MQVVQGSWGRKLVCVLALVGGCLLLGAPAAMGAPPVNDKFEDAEVLGPGLPVLALGSNLEATDEGGEDPYDVFTAGHSVWFRWTAPSDEKVTVDTCNSEFTTSLTVFTGATLGSLAEVARDSNVDGRYCPDAAGATLEAAAGTTYSIMIDGYALSFPGGSAPVVQGSFELKLDRFRPAESEASTPAESTPQETSQPPEDTKPPNTRIVRRVLKRRPPIFVFRFRSNERGSTFRCKLDKQKYRRCGKVKRFRCLRGRRHVLHVVAVDPSGNRDRSPAVTRFKPKCKPDPRPRRKHRQR